MSFKSLGLSDALLKAISKKGYTTPSPIQQKAIPRILERKDVLASAQTGTGKTAGFALPEKILHNRPIRSLILTPTRELAAQVLQDFKDYGEFTDLRSTVVFGGVGANPQIRTLKQGVDILVATPGRLLDLHSQKALSLAKVEVLVLDEADRMLDMGFLRDIKRILALIPSRRQNLLFSATFSKEIKQLANGFLHHMIRNFMGTLIKVGKGEQPVSWVKQVLESKDRTQAGMTAAPNGLTFCNVSYPEKYKIPILESKA